MKQVVLFSLMTLWIGVADAQQTASYFKNFLVKDIHSTRATTSFTVQNIPGQASGIETFVVYGTNLQNLCHSGYRYSSDTGKINSSFTIDGWCMEPNTMIYWRAGVLDADGKEYHSQLSWFMTGPDKRPVVSSMITTPDYRKIRLQAQISDTANVKSQYTIRFRDVNGTKETAPRNIPVGGSVTIDTTFYGLNPATDFWIGVRTWNIDGSIEEEGHVVTLAPDAPNGTFGQVIDYGEHLYVESDFSGNGDMTSSQTDILDLQGVQLYSSGQVQRGYGPGIITDYLYMQIPNGQYVYRLVLANDYGTDTVTHSFSVYRSSTGLSEQEGTLELYPNPAHEVVFVTTVEPSTVLVTDISGRVVMEKMLNPGRNRLSVADLPGGVYLLILPEMGMQEKLLIVH